MPFRDVRAFRLTAIWLVLLLPSCQDDVVEPPRPDVPEEISTLPPGIHPVLSIPGLESLRSGSQALVRVHLHAVDVPDVVASFQGEVRFDTEAIVVQGGSFPEGILGAWNLTGPGVVRFAGATLEGVGSRPVLELAVEVRRPLKTEDFSVVMEEVVATEAFRVLTPQVARSESVILTPARLDAGGR